MKKLFYLILSLPAVVLSGCTKESAMGAPSNGIGVGGSTARFTIAGNYLYVVDNTSLKAFDIADPSAAPVLKSKTDIGINVETIFPYQDKLFVGSSYSMYIFSLNDPTKPKQIAKADYTIRMSCDPVVAKDSTAYATLNSTGPCGWTGSALVVYDIKDISRPRQVTSIPLNSPHGLGVQDSALYVCHDMLGLDVYNTRNSYDPQRVRTVTGRRFIDVIPYGNLLICQVVGGLALYDISIRHNPVFLSEILD
jgi:hypothetical protein